MTGLRQAINWNIKSLLVFGDSQLVIKQVIDEYHTKDEKLLPYRRIVEDLRQHFIEIMFQQIPRANNKAADVMATIASMISMPEYSPKCEFLIENLFTPAYEKTDSKLVCDIFGPESPWYTDIFAYLCHKTIPIALTPNQRKTFIHRTTRYTILGDTLF